MQSEIDDLAPLCVPKSDQLNADDLIEGPRVFTIARITKGPKGKKGDQPVHVHLAEFPRGPWKPPVSIRRLLMELWGGNPARWPDAARVELFRDPEVYFGDEKSGGIRVCGMSHIKEPTMSVLVTTGRGKRTEYIVHRLDAQQQQRPTADLDQVLADADLTVADLDRWRSSEGKAPTSTLTDEQRAGLAGWLLGDPARITKIAAMVPMEGGE